MKKNSLFFAMSIVVFLCSSCKKNEPIQPSPGARMVIIKFNHPEQLNKVIVQHPIKKINGTNGYFEYDEKIGLSLNVLAEPYVGKHNYSLKPSVVRWMEEEMLLTGSSPYIPLTDDYYMVDWKWHDLLPVSAFGDVLASAYSNPFEDHLIRHCFLTDINWADLKDLNATYDNSAQSLEKVETKRILFRAIDQLYSDIKKVDPYVCWNMSLYYNGLNVKNAYMYYLYGACDADSGKNYRTYINYCDSLQGVYQKRLIEIINKRQLNKVEDL